MPGKMKVPAPIDRPLSRAYLRGFTGWSTAYSPGQSEPTSLRLMENMMIDRNGAIQVRPGLRYLSYATSPDINPDIDNDPGIAIDRPMVGTQEPFYVASGKKALLFAVREANNTVGFRAILFDESLTVVHKLTDEEIGFDIPQGEEALQFTPETTHVEYLQIDNKIIAMSDVGEEIRMFFVGAEKIAKRLSAITMPLWEDTHKLKVVHPDKAWIDQQATTTRRNEIYNPSFEAGVEYWTKSALCGWATNTASPRTGTTRLKLTSLPTRTNMAPSPLYDVAAKGTTGWYPHADYGSPKLSKDGTYMKIYDSKGKGTFLAYGAKITTNVVAREKYRVAVDHAEGSHVQAIVVVTWYNSSGAKIGNSTSLELPGTTSRYTSPVLTAPAGTVSMRISLGGRNSESTATYVKMRNLMVCLDGESTAMFHGSTPDVGTTHIYSWVGAVNASASIDHPAANVAITSASIPVRANSPYWGSIYAASSLAKPFTVAVHSYDKDNKLVNTYTGTVNNTTAGGGWVRGFAGTAAAAATTVKANMTVTFTGLARGEVVYVDSAMLESGVVAVGTYFDGSTAATTTTTNQWGNTAKPHRSFSVQTVKTVGTVIPPEVPTAKTLIAAGGAANNPYKVAFFYTFENEVGESAASKILEVRVSRPPSNWIWETANAAGEPSGIATEVAELCADQLICQVPQIPYDQAVVEGALKWNLYMFTWSDQEAVPVVAQLISEKILYADEGAAVRSGELPYLEGSWIAVTPARRVGINDVMLPTRANRVNYSVPPRSRTGLVAGDRLIVLGDPLAGLATIRWTSNRPGEYTNFTSARGGGSKVLTSGNLNVPASVVLWQNPQSVDTLTVLCMSLDGMSVSYYMMPATVNAQQSTTGIMGFEETTSTPGTVSPYGDEVLNNALFRPTDKALLKSSASNYNISHKTLSDKIENMWRALRSKEWIMSDQLNNRLCYLVNNPYGEVLEPGCKGNELWIYDVAAENGFWSRFLIQGAALRVFTLSGKDYLGVTKPDGLYYLDPDARLDDYVVSDPLDPDYLKVLQRPIPWKFETNTQGANRAHDAWAHLQQIQITLGSFIGTMRYGIRGQDLNHRIVDTSKIFSDDRAAPEDGTTWDVDDILQVRRDMKEWYFYASSVEGLPSSGLVGYVQYRYTPVSVNVGYEYGSVESFEYGNNVLTGPNGYSDNGIPVPAIDFTRP